MLKNLLTNETYGSRKEAKEKLGHSNFNRMLKNREFAFLNDDSPNRTNTLIDEDNGTTYYTEDY